MLWWQRRQIGSSTSCVAKSSCAAIISAFRRESGSRVMKSFLDPTSVPLSNSASVLGFSLPSTVLARILFSQFSRKSHWTLDIWSPPYLVRFLFPALGIDLGLDLATISVPECPLLLAAPFSSFPSTGCSFCSLTMNLHLSCCTGDELSSLSLTLE